MPDSFWKRYIPIFCISLTVLLWEILLTRIYSVTLFYHFAFMAVSLAMFGLTLGAVLALLRWNTHSNQDQLLGQLALLSGFLIPISILIQLSLPIASAKESFQFIIFCTFILSTLPLVPAGAFICLMLSHSHSLSIGKLYAWDLSGAATACLCVPILLSIYGAPGGICIAAVPALLAAFLLLRRSKITSSRVALGLAFFLVIFSLINSQTDWFRIRWNHSGYVNKPLYEKWNAYSRVIVYPFSDTPFGWGIARDIMIKLHKVHQLYLEIDSGAGTPLTFYDGKESEIEHLRYDISGIAHRLRPNANVFIIGVGGGRDVLTAIAYHQQHIMGAEINNDILKIDNQYFANFTGHLNHRPEVQFLNEEGRSFLTRTDQHFNIIQASLVDTAAATASGAYAFVENSLYTTEAWRLFFHRLKPGGVVSFSRWYYGSAEWPVEIYRMIVLASTALKAEGISDPLNHIILVRPKNITTREGVATLLVSPQPFSNEDLLTIHHACDDLNCEVALSSRDLLDKNFLPLMISNQKTLDQNFLLDVTAPTDDHPYFFFHTRLKDLWKKDHSNRFNQGSQFNSPAIKILMVTAELAIILASLLIVMPPCYLYFKGRWSKSRTRHSTLFPIYFALIGLGFMFIEIGIMQRFSLFLSHPIYGFTVVLFGLLTTSSIGSFFSQTFQKLPGRYKKFTLFLLVFLLLAVNFLSQEAVGHLLGSSIIFKIAISLCLLFPIGFFMGFLFPMGMELVHQQQDERAAWYWSINGASSVVGSVAAICFALNFGITATLWIGAAMYFFTFLVYRILIS